MWRCVSQVLAYKSVPFIFAECISGQNLANETQGMAGTWGSIRVLGMSDFSRFPILFVALPKPNGCDRQKVVLRFCDVPPDFLPKSH